VLTAGQATDLHNASRGNAGGRSYLDQIRNGSHAVFSQVDMTSVRTATATVSKAGDQVGGELELRLDAPDGKLIGRTDFKNAKSFMVREGINALTAKFAIERTTGKHDLFVVFKNSTSGDKRLFYFGEVGLSNK
jgi:cytochrome c